MKIVQIESSFAGGPAIAGTYRVGKSISSDTRGTVVTLATFVANLPIVEAGTLDDDAGSVTFTTVSPTRVTGSFAVTLFSLTDGGRTALSGVFDAPTCSF